MQVKTVFVALVLATLLACSGGGEGSGGTAPPALVSIAVAPDAAVFGKNCTQQFTATGTYSDGSRSALTSSATWTSTNAAVATIDGAGLATLLSAGTTTITVFRGGVTGYALMTVTAGAEHSADADGFLWGTEGNVNTADANALPSEAAAARNAINGTLRTRYVKLRISRAFFSTTDGTTFSTVYCLPSASACNTSFNMDEVAKHYEANGWSMVPMLRTNETQTVTTALIDDYVNWVDWFVGRYRTSASIERIELVNSPLPGTGAASNWKGTNAQLVELTNKTYDRIKGAYPSISVGTPGFEYWVDSTSGSDGAFIAVIEYFLDKDNGAKFDFWAFHGYPLRGRDAQNRPVGPYPPTMTPLVNKYANIPGILQVRAALDANGWQDRKIIDTEHDNITDPGRPITAESDALDAAYAVQELVLKRTLASGGTPVMAGALPLKMAPRGSLGEAGLSSLNADGSVTGHVKAMALLWSRLKEYPYAGHVSGAFDDETQAWVEKFASGKKELYIFFKPFKYVSGQKIALDGQTLAYALSLGGVPSSALVTDITGSTTAMTAAQELSLAAENSPKFLEVTYP